MGSSKKKSKPIIENLTVTAMSTTGKGIGRINNKVVFIEKALSGDIVDIQIIKSKKEYAEAYITNLKEKSVHRIEPVCRYFGICGGCSFLNADYQFQLDHKENMVIENLHRIGNLNNFNNKPIIGASQNLFYRNKMEFSFSVNPWFMPETNQVNEIKDLRTLGFHVKGRFDKILDIEKCFLQADPSNNIRNTIRDIAKVHQLDFYNVKTNSGFIRSLFIRITRTKEAMINIVFSSEKTEVIHQFLNDIIKQLHEISSIYYFINPKVNESIYDLTPVHFYGESFITENIDHILLQVGPKSFLQTNSYQSELLYRSISEMAEIQKDDIVYDLFCGVGSIGLYVAGRAGKVIGIEAISESVTEAEINKEINGISNISFVTGLVEKVFTPDFISEHGKAGIVILDPPRSGLHPSTIETLLVTKVEKIIYVSCNPSTQARDIALLSSLYDLKTIQPVDMFPQTTHVENIALMKIK